MDVPVTFDPGYIAPFKALARSVILNNPSHRVRFLLVHSSVG